MNDFFDKLGAAAKRAASTVASEVNVAAEEQKIRECYQALGKLYYQAVKGGMAPDQDAAGYCERIDASLRRIADLKGSHDVTGSVKSEPIYAEPAYADPADFADAE